MEGRKFIHFVKENWHIIFLLIFLIFGFYLRVYHVDYPVVGYHNWKETHYLTESRNFARDGFFEHGFFVPEHDYPIIGTDSSGAHSDTFPIISILVGFLFMIFGPSLFLARLVVIFFGVGSILMMYLLVKRLFNNSLLALTAAAITTITPLFVFFTRNVQLISPGLFFMLSALYFYISWIFHEKPKDIIFATLFLTLTFLTKYPFLVIIIPMIFVFPFKRIKHFKKYFKELTTSLIIGSFAILWYFYSNIVIAKKFGVPGITSSLIDFSLVFSYNWWQIIARYLSDNYTFIVIFFAFIGFISLFIIRQRTISKRFMWGYYVGLILFLFIMGKKLQGHSYHQFPIAPLIIISASFGIVFLATFISSFFKKIFIKNERVVKGINYLLVLSFLILILVPSLESINRQFDTQFIGLDVAGDFIKLHKLPGERMVNSGHQDYGVLWHADMKGIKGVINNNLSYLKRAEEDLNVSWLFLYQWGLSVIEETDKWEYIQNHYSLAQFAFIKEPNGINRPLYFILRKGGTFNLSKLDEILSRYQINQKKYEFTSGSKEIYYINLINN